MARDLSPVQTVLVGALNATFETLENYLLTLGTLYKQGFLLESTYDAAEASISADMKVLSDKYEAMTGEPISLFATV